MTKTYKAFVVEKQQDKTFSSSVKLLNVSDLPNEDVLVRVHYSSVNFKDYMSWSGNPAVTRRFPHTPGIDAAGIVVSSKNDTYSVGDKVMIVAEPMGLSSPGGFGQYICVPYQWLSKLDADSNLEHAMAFGTSGYTAALSVLTLEKNLHSLRNKKIIVTGATGGLGSIAVALLNQKGCHVTAVTGKEFGFDFLKAIGAEEVISRVELEQNSGQNLLQQKWDGAIDVAGGQILSTILRMIHDNGCVIATGMVNGTGFNTNVLPFILRGISLVGVNAENSKQVTRQAIWEYLTTIHSENFIDRLYKIIELDDLGETFEMINTGKSLGKIVVNMK